MQEYTPGAFNNLAQQFRSIVPDSEIDFERIIAENVAAQRSEIEGPTTEELKNEFVATMTGQRGKTKIGDFVVSSNPEAATKIYNSMDANLKLELQNEFMGSRRVMPQEEGRPVVPFSGPQYEKIRLSPELKKLPKEAQDKFVELVSNRQNLAKIFVSNDYQLADPVMDILMDSFVTGDFSNELYRSVTNIPGDFARAPTLVGLAGSAISAGATAFAVEDDEFGLQRSYGEQFKVDFDKYMSVVGTTLAPYENALNNYSLGMLDSAATDVQAWYKNLFFSKFDNPELAQKAWYATGHQRLTPRFYNPGDEGFDPQMNNGEGYVGPVVDAEGNPVPEDIGLPPQLVNDMIDLSYRELPGYQKAAIFAATTVPLTVGFTGMMTRKGVKASNRVLEERRNNPAGTQDLTDFQVYKKYIKGKNENYDKDGWAALWRGVTMNIGSTSPGTLNVGRQMTRHYANIKDYDDKIADLNGFINDPVGKLDDMGSYSPFAAERVSILKYGNPQEVAQAQKELNTYFGNQLTDTRNRLNSYMSRHGGAGTLRELRKERGEAGGFINPLHIGNPYQRSLFKDDILISTAVGYAPNALPMLNPETAEIIVALTAPIVAPMALRTTASIPGAIPMIKDVPYEMANLFENMPLVGTFAKAYKEGKDTAGLRSMLEEMDIPITDDTIKAYGTFRKVYESAHPSMRQNMDNAFRDYNETMSGIEASFRRDGVFSDDEIQDMMSTLHLSVAEASGLAPFIAIQQRAGQFTPRDMLNPKKMGEIARAIDEEFNGYVRLGRLMDAFTEKYTRKTGFDPTQNDTLQEFVQEFARASAEGLDRISLKRQTMLAQINKFARMPESEIDVHTVDDIVQLKTLYSGDEIRETVDKAELIADTTIQLQEGARVQLRELAGVSDSLSQKELAGEVAIAVDVLFDAELGHRYAMGRIPYSDADQYAIDNNILIDLRDLAENLHTTSTGLKESFSSSFGTGREYLSKIGNRAERSFERAAERGLRLEYGDGIDAMMQRAGVTSYLDYALTMIKGDPDSVVFRATPSEAEDIARDFRKYEANQLDIPEADVSLNRFSKAVDQAYANADETFLKMMQDARSTWSKTVGEGTDKGTLAGDVRVTRRNVQTRAGTEGLHRWQKSPMVAFTKLSDNIASYVSGGNTPKKQAELYGLIQQQKEYLMQFLSGGKSIAGEYGFDLTNQRSRISADSASTVLELLVTKSLNQAYEADLKKFVGEQFAYSYGSNLPTREEALKMMATRNNYDFGRSKRLREIEELMAVPVSGGSFDDVGYHTPILRTEEGVFRTIGSPGREGIGPPAAPPKYDITGASYGEGTVRFREGVQYRKLFQGATIDRMTMDIDALIKNDAEVRKVYDSLRSDLNDMNSSFMEGVRREDQRLQENLKQFGRYGDLAKNPVQFFDAVFLNATPSSIADIKISLSQNMNIPMEQVDATLAYMYQKGFSEKVKQRKSFHSQDIEGIDSILYEPQALIEFTSGANGQVMKYVLGDEHYNDMKLLAKYARKASGDSAGFRISPDIRPMTLDNVFSKSFNLARGMVSLPYVTAEVGGRLMLLRRQSMIQLALEDKVAARIMGRILDGDDKITRKDLDLFGARIKMYLGRGMLYSKGEIPAVDAFFEDEAATREQEVLTEDASTEDRERENIRVRLEALKAELEKLGAIPETQRTADDNLRTRVIVKEMKKLTEEANR